MRVIDFMPLRGEAIDGGRRLTEFELPELPGYEGSRPVRVGNFPRAFSHLTLIGAAVAIARADSRGAA